jgi:hypothetical protein
MSLTTEQVAGLVSEIKTELEKEREALSTGLEHARRAGELLLKVREEYEYGTWEEWLREHFDMSERTAQDYIRLAKHWSDIEAALKESAQPLADLSFGQALRLISKKPDGTHRPAPNKADVREVILTALARHGLNIDVDTFLKLLAELGIKAGSIRPPKNTEPIPPTTGE